VSGPRSANTVVAAGRREPVVLLGIGLVAVVASLWRPASYGGWFLESLAVLVAIPLRCSRTGGSRSRRWRTG
jgi:hypothetical protein